MVLDNDSLKPQGGRYPGQDGDASAAHPGHLHCGQYWISSSVTLITDSSLYIHQPHICVKHLIKRISPRCKVETGGRLRISNMFFPQKHFCVATIIIIIKRIYSNRRELFHIFVIYIVLGYLKFVR